MTLTVRIDPLVQQKLAEYAQRTQQTKSDVVNQAISEFLERHSENRPTPWDLLKDLIPVEADPQLPRDLASRRKEYLSEYFKEKHARRRGPAGRDV